jgi:hypothetical protein
MALVKLFMKLRNISKYNITLNIMKQETMIMPIVIFESLLRLKWFPNMYSKAPITNRAGRSNKKLMEISSGNKWFPNI